MLRHKLSARHKLFAPTVPKQEQGGDVCVEHEVPKQEQDGEVRVEHEVPKQE